MTDTATSLPTDAWCLTHGVPVTFGAGAWRHPDTTPATACDVGQPPQPSAEARRIGAKALVEVGCTVRSSTRRDSDDNFLGGTVLETDEWIDFDTGERRRKYLCIDTVHDRGRPFRIRWIDEAELGEFSVEMPNPAFLKAHVHRLATAIVKATGKGGPIMPEVVDWSRWVQTLLVLLVHGGRA